MGTVNMFLSMKRFRHIHKTLVYDYNDGGRYVIEGKAKLRRQFGDRFVRQIIFYNGGYVWLVLERIPFGYME